MEQKSNQNNYFGLSKEAYESLLSSTKRSKYKPSELAKSKVSEKYNLSLNDSEIVLKLIHSPAAGCFTSYDILSYLKSKENNIS
jgi:hypothetical protein